MNTKKVFDAVLKKIIQTILKSSYNSKIKKIQINRGLGLAAQNTNILKKVLTEFTQLQGKNP